MVYRGKKDRKDPEDEFRRFFLLSFHSSAPFLIYILYFLLPVRRVDGESEYDNG